MNQLAAVERSSRTVAVPAIVARLDLTDDDQRHLHDLIRRFHAGRWPLLRALGMRQAADGAIIEAAEWLRTVGPRYSLITWHRDGNGLQMQSMASRRAAIAALGT